MAHAFRQLLDPKVSCAVVAAYRGVPTPLGWLRSTRRAGAQAHVVCECAFAVTGPAFSPAGGVCVCVPGRRHGLLHPGNPVREMSSPTVAGARVGGAGVKSPTNKALAKLAGKKRDGASRCVCVHACVRGCV